MASLWNARERQHIQSRISGLAQDTTPRWGQMSVGQMLVHCANDLRVALGEMQVRPLHAPLSLPFLKQLIIYVLPVPKGLPAYPEIRDPIAGEWSSDRAALHQLVDRFAAQDERRSWPRHPAFGRLSGRAWGALSYKHLDHHLKQFGV
jgi:hypothetical protein